MTPTSISALLRRTSAGLAIACALTLLYPPCAQGQAYQAIHKFVGSDGSHPRAGLTIDRGGKLYGTTSQGGSQQAGTVFRLSPAGSGWVLSSLYSFKGGADGYLPWARVVFGTDGALYGTTFQGGDLSRCPTTGCGTVFRLQPPPTTCKTVVCPWTKAIIHNFEGPTQGFDGQEPLGDLTFDQAGNLYGTTQLGGQYGQGAVYALTRSGGGWVATTIYSFTNSFGQPFAGVTFGPDGNLYGTVSNVFHFWGGVYRLVHSGSTWTEEDIYKFNLADGSFPYAGIVFDNAGNFYGATSSDGPNGGGTVFKLSSASGGWSFSVVYPFTGGRGSGPLASLIFDAAGNLYGTTNAQGQFELGSVFRLAPGSNGWTYTSLYDFNDAGVAAYPISNVVFDASGSLYGTTSLGSTPAFCSGGCGIIWQITP